MSVDSCDASYCIRYAMPTRDEFDDATALFDKAVAMYEAAKVEFETLRRKIRSEIRENVDYQALELAQWKLFKSRARLMRVFREKDRRERPQ